MLNGMYTMPRDSLKKSQKSTRKPGAKSAPPATSDHSSHNWHNLDNRLSLIAEAAYFRAEKREFEPGHEEADWLEAEQELAEIMGVA